MKLLFRRGHLLDAAGVMKKIGVTTIPPEPNSDSTHWLFCLVCLFLGSAVLFAAFKENDGRLLTGGVGGAFFLFGLVMMIRRKCVINWAQSMVVVEFKLFGKYTMRRKQISFSEFDRILISRHGNDDNQPINLVSLRKRAGGKVPLRYFHASGDGVCYEALDFAERLASDLGLEIAESQQYRRASLFQK